jgi:hypothetical protein
MSRDLFKMSGANPEYYEGCHGPGEEPELSPLDLHTPSFTHTNSHLCDFLESYFLQEEVKLIKRISNHLLTSTAGCPWASISEHLSLMQDQESSQSWRGSSASRGIAFCLSLSPATRRLLSHTGAPPSLESNGNTALCVERKERVGRREGGREREREKEREREGERGREREKERKDREKRVFFKFPLLVPIL